MIRNSVVVLAGVALLGLGIRAIADDATTNPSTPQPKSSHSRIVAPFNLLPDLTDDQREKIRDIHSQTLDAERELRAKEHDEIEALLTDDQKKELDDLETKASAEKKYSQAEKRAQSEEEKAQQLKQEAEGAATTQPSGGQ